MLLNNVEYTCNHIADSEDGRINDSHRGTVHLTVPHIFVGRERFEMGRDECIDDPNLASSEKKKFPRVESVPCVEDR